MGWGSSLIAKIARRSDDAASKVVLPQPVDHHAGGDGILRRDNPTRQRQAAIRTAITAGFRNLWFAGGENAGETRLYFVPWRMRISAHQYKRLWSTVALFYRGQRSVKLGRLGPRHAPLLVAQ